MGLVLFVDWQANSDIFGQEVKKNVSGELNSHSSSVSLTVDTQGLED